MTLKQRQPQWIYGFVRAVVVGFSRVYWRLTITGRENVPNGPFVLAPGAHRSNVETPLVCAITRRRLRYMGKDTLWKFRWSAWFLTTLGGFPVNRGAADRAAMRACIDAVEGGEPVVMFPEGTRQSGPVIEEIFDGPAYVASRMGIPILPVGIGGAEKAMPPGMKFPRPVKMALIIGPPIPPPSAPAGKRVSRRAVSETSERLKVTLQDLFDDAQRLVGDPNPPPVEAGSPAT